MPGLEEFKKFFSQQRCLNLNVVEKDVHRYETRMMNCYLDQEGEVKKRQHLKSVFSRKITGIPRHNLLLTEINIEQVNFNDDGKESRWRFAEGTKVPFYIYHCRGLNEGTPGTGERDERDEQDRENSPVKNQLQGINKILSGFSGSRAESLFTLQLFDILGFEELNGHFLSYFPRLVEEPGRTVEMESLPGARNDIRKGETSRNSIFRGGKLFGTYHGVNRCLGKLCDVFGCVCEAPQHSSAAHTGSQGSSAFHSGELYIDMETGIILKAVLFENVYPVQDKTGGPDGKIPVNIRRIELETRTYRE